MKNRDVFLWVRKLMIFLPLLMDKEASKDFKGKLKFDKNQHVLFAHCNGAITVTFPA